MGNEGLKARLRAQTAARGLSHAYLISGPEGSGKHTLARVLAAAFLCGAGGDWPCGTCQSCRKVKEGIHPDVRQVKSPAVGEVRALRKDVYLRPNEGSRKITIIEGMETVNPSAQNALLKVLEEGPEYAVFLLLTQSEEQVLETVTAPRLRKEKSTTDTYPDALDKFGCPAGILPLNEDGLRQLRIITVPDYRQKLIRRLLGKDYLPPVNRQSDGRSQSSGENFLIGIDCHIKRFESISTTKEGAAAHIILLSTQAAAVQQILKGRSAILHPISMQLAEQILGLPPQLPEPDQSPFQTGKGRYLYAPSFG